MEDVVGEQEKREARGPGNDFLLLLIVNNELYDGWRFEDQAEAARPDMVRRQETAVVRDCVSFKGLFATSPGMGTGDSQCFRGADRGGETRGTGLAAIFNSPLAATGTGIVDRGPFSIPTHWRIDGPRWMGGRSEWEECIGKAEGGVGVPFCLKRPRVLPRS